MSSSLDMLTAEIVALKERVGALEAVELPVTAIACRVYNSANISIATGANTGLTFDGERYDPNGMHSTSTNTGRITISVPGIYLVIADIRFAANATGRRTGYLQINATTVIGRIVVPVNSGTVVTEMIVAAMYQFAAGDYVEAYVFQDSGGNLNVEASANTSPEFMAVRIA